MLKTVRLDPRSLTLKDKAQTHSDVYAGRETRHGLQGPLSLYGDLLVGLKVTVVCDTTPLGRRNRDSHICVVAYYSNNG